MKIIHTSGKRKQAIARATIRPGKGQVTVNNVAIDVFSPELYRLRIKEPLLLAGSIREQVDVTVKMRGGGMASQADAARLAIARGIIKFTQDEKLEDRYMKYDRTLLVADVRRKESAKPNRHGQARAKRQKSYR